MSLNGRLVELQDTSDLSSDRPKAYEGWSPSSATKSSARFNYKLKMYFMFII